MPSVVFRLLSPDVDDVTGKKVSDWLEEGADLLSDWSRLLRFSGWLLGCSDVWFGAILSSNLLFKYDIIKLIKLSIIKATYLDMRYEYLIWIIHKCLKLLEETSKTVWMKKKWFYSLLTFSLTLLFLHVLSHSNTIPTTILSLLKPSKTENWIKTKLTNFFNPPKPYTSKKIKKVGGHLGASNINTRKNRLAKHNDFIYNIKL